MATLPDAEPLDYTIHSVSSFSAAYSPENIKVDAPSDQASRWSGANTLAAATASKEANPQMVAGTKDRQWVCLKLERTAVVRQITFGKFSKPHPCNLREFKVYGGMSPAIEQMALLHHGGLKNDSAKETFELRKTNAEGVTFPCEYIRIEPLVAHSPNYNVSIWHVALAGVIEPAVVDQVSREYERFREVKTLRLMLKHLRQRGMYEAYESVRAHISAPPLNVVLEHPLLTSLHDAFVLRGDFNTAEAILSRAAFTPLDRLASSTEEEEQPVPIDRVAQDSPTLFTTYMREATPKLVWQRLDTLSSTADLNGDAPGPRGGHQLIFCPAHAESNTSACIYLLGGWNGRQDLADFWRFDLAPPSTESDMDVPSVGRWALLSKDVSAEKGPSPRSCHKACLDERTGEIFVMGRFVDCLSISPDARLTASAFPSDFYRYHTRGERAGTWEVLSNDMQSEGGPATIYDHQMVVDPTRELIYVFGGKIVQVATQEAQYSGLFTYHIPSRKWSCVMSDPEPGEAQSKRILSRIGHSMLLDSRKDKIYIFAGQRNEAYLSDLWVYDLASNDLSIVTEDYSVMGGPDGGFTQRATIDPELGEWHMLSGLMMDRRNRASTVRNSLWIRRYEAEAWVHLEGTQDGPAEEPKPRYAHQMVYDPLSKVHYLFGGNPSDLSDTTARLGDFWRLQLVRMSASEVLRKARFIVRRQRFVEMCASDSPMNALLYLQSAVASVTDHSDEREAAAFRACMAHLLVVPPSRSESNAGSPASAGPLPLPAHVVATTDDDDADAVMASSQDFDPANKPGGAPSRATTMARLAVFEDLLQFFPREARQPSEDLIDVAR